MDLLAAIDSVGAELGFLDCGNDTLLLRLADQLVCISDLLLRLFKLLLKFFH